MHRPKKQELESFCNGMYEMYNFIKEVDPDLILFPLRGAYPFGVSYEKITELKGEEPIDHLYLAIGTLYDIENRRIRGSTVPEKEEVVEKELLIYLTNNPETRRVLLIDEVMNGGTIRKNLKTIRKVINRLIGIKQEEDKSRNTLEIKVCAIEDENHTPEQHYINRAKKYGFHRIKVPLFVMDNEEYLPRIIRYGKGSKKIEVQTEEKKLRFILEAIEGKMSIP